MSNETRADHTASEGDSRAGFLFALGAYLIWGALPLYLKLVAHIPVVEVIAHRILWSVPVAGLVLIWLKRTSDLTAAIRSPRMLGMAALTAALISINWGVYVWSIANDRALDTALGYYINPLFSVFLASIVLRERLSRAQLVAIGLAAIGVAIITYEAGSLPWISVALAITWGFYALCRRALPIGPNQGFMLEVLILTPAALGWIIYTYQTNISHFGPTGIVDLLLLIGMGIATAVPLMLYGNGAKRLRLSTIGMMQYIAPTCIFLVAVFVFKEPFSAGRALGFVFIWAALAVYSWSMLRSMRRKPRAS